MRGDPTGASLRCIADRSDLRYRTLFAHEISRRARQPGVGHDEVVWRCRIEHAGKRPSLVVQPSEESKPPVWSHGEGIDATRAKSKSDQQTAVVVKKQVSRIVADSERETSFDRSERAVSFYSESTVGRRICNIAFI